MIVLLTAQAEAELEAIGDHVAERDPVAALHLVRDLRALCERLAHLPERYLLVPRYESSAVRRAVHGNYLVFYRAESERVVVLHVLHGAMDYEPILFAGG